MRASTSNVDYFLSVITTQPGDDGAGNSEITPYSLPPPYSAVVAGHAPPEVAEPATAEASHMLVNESTSAKRILRLREAYERG